MPNSTTLDDRGFRRILVRNVTLPLAAGVVSAGVFVVLLAYLITTMNWVEHSERVIGNANQVSKEMVDMETGMRGYMLARRRVLLAAVRGLQAQGRCQLGRPGKTGRR